MVITMGMDRYKHGYFFESSPHSGSDYPQTKYFVKFGCREGFLFPATTWRSASLPWTGCSIRVDDRQTFCIRYGYTPHGQSATFEFNPALLTDEGRIALGCCLQLCLFAEIRGFVKYGHVRQAEIAIDVEGADYFDHAFIDVKARSHDAHYAELGTTYIGCETSARSLKCYSKSKQLRETFGIDSTVPILRIEATLCPTLRTNLLEFPLVRNPFESLIVVDRDKLSQSKHAIAKRLAKAVDRGDLAQNAFRTITRQLSPALRCSLNEHLTRCAADWWRPEKIWAENAPSLIDWLPPCFTAAGLPFEI